jgi:hypothetical protein
MTRPPVVDFDTWQAASDELLVREPPLGASDLPLEGCAPLGAAALGNLGVDSLRGEDLDRAARHGH